MADDLAGLAILGGIGWLIASIAVAVTASKRGKEGFPWFLLSIFISPLMAVLVLIASPMGAGGRVPCERCAEGILPAAEVCPFCGVERKNDSADAPDSGLHL